MPADTPFPSEELVAFLEDQGYELEDLNIRQRTRGGSLDYFIVVIPPIPPDNNEPDDTWDDDPGFAREYELSGEGSVSKLIWLACQLMHIERNEYPDTRQFRVAGWGTFGPYDVPVFTHIDWMNNVESRPHVVVRFDDTMDIEGPAYPYGHLWMHEFLGKSSIDPSEITEADAQLMVNQMVPGISEPYPDWIYSLGSESELVSWQWRTTPTGVVFLDIEYASPVPLEITLVNPEGDVVCTSDSNDIQGDFLGQSIDTFSLYDFSPISGTYQLVVKPYTMISGPDQVVETIRTHDIPLD
ncbi:MAG: hypothetical protein JSV77_04985 [Dehalococcoidales bacterium]|nr:MAG: hypothetical protein JSV77_04985 [Dehalococcoidales bacterium]